MPNFSEEVCSGMNERINMLLARVFDISEEDVVKNLSRDDIEKWDSLTHMDLVITLEKEFGVVLTVDDIISMSTLDDIREILNRAGVE